MSVPNAISLFRLFIAPLFTYLILIDKEVFALIIVFIAAISDWLDGFIARRLNQVTKTGQLLDPLVDKLFIMIVFLSLYAADLLPLFACLLLIFRDLCMIAVGCFYYFRGGQNIPANWMGKTTTILNYVIIVLMLFEWFEPFNHYILWATIVFSAYTAIRYGVDVTKLNRSKLEIK